MELNKLYAFVGPKEILKRVDPKYKGHQIESLEDISQWILLRKNEIYNHSITVTFIISKNKKLLISDRRSEHVMCALGEKVYSAGEITFNLDAKEIYIGYISNQSTGYCPEPSSWNIVQEILTKIKIEHPENFTNAYDFRYCWKCDNINLIKEEIYECAICYNSLNTDWNFEKKLK